jgi:hypothetical protein
MHAATIVMSFGTKRRDLARPAPLSDGRSSDAASLVDFFMSYSMANVIDAI